MEDQLRLFLLLGGTVFIIAVLAHGIWKIRKNSKPSETIRIPTQYITSVSAFGVRTTTEPKTKWSYWFAISLALMSLGSFLYDYNRNLGSGCEGGCEALAILTGGAALIAALTVFLVNSSSDTGAERREVIAKTFQIE